MTRYCLLAAVVALSANMFAAQPRSLDEIERDSFGAQVSPVALPGIEMQKTGKVKNYKPTKKISLSGAWLITPGETLSSWNNAVSAIVPGSIHGALYKAGVIPDPTIGMNDSIAEKQSYRHWWYKREFDYDGKLKNPQLHFGGIANKCIIYLNGKEIGRHEGMLSGFDLNPDTLLRKGHNVLTVHLEPIPQSGNEGANTTWVNTVVANCVYGWHYVKVPTLGIWRDVELRERPDKPINKPFILTKDTEGHMRMVVNLPASETKSRISLTVKPKNFEGKAQRFTADVTGQKGETALDFKIDNPELWWPNGYGKQPVYTATVAYETEGNTDVESVNFGVRTLEMRPVGGTPREDTYNWQFVVNGKPIFVKGANWCLMDFMMDLSTEKYDRFLGAAKEQHLNFLRAWGGGLVETDLFYDMCDEMGLMVMQEWPTAWNSHNFQKADLLRETVDYNTERIRSHPSLVMWAGGNESAEPFGPAIDYMGKKSIEADGTRPFHRGEPWGGSSHNHDSWWLDLHLNNALNMSAVFFGEFGMPSLPVRETVDRYLNGEEYSYPLKPGTVFEHHAPTFGAWQDMRLLFRESGWFTDPTTLDNMILGSQLAQTMGTRRAMERARTRWPDQAAGAAYYKINDVFPGLSWGSVDYYGAKKMTHYFVKRSSSPCMPVILFNQTNLTGLPARLDYFLLDDTLSLAGKPVVAHVSVYDRLMKKIYERSDTVTAQCSVNRLPDICLDKKQTTATLLYFKTDIRDMDGKLIARNWYIENFDSKQNAILEAPKARLDIRQTGNTVEISNMSAEIPAVAVNIEVAGQSGTLTMSDNVLWIDPGETRTVTLNTTQPANVTAWNKE